MMGNNAMDSKIIELLSKFTLTKGEIYSVFGGKWDGTPEEYKKYRQIGRRLQALKKKHEINFWQGFGWGISK